ncbi:hypothetical protein LXT21_41060 [Myxococcus sp. K38C18041901]|uniref:hypothetical protein n=1 Tax=Myxococcus guangdongensis TaxID=2906760 RepID=UPI0020A770FE|nr:hypothetical protein [Myxococcus guangdongensis]MCP3065183.1 hypothetical protein [Myxococcus guangdongensis]
MTVSLGSGPSLTMTVTQRKRAGDPVSTTLLGACAFFRAKRMGDAAKLMRERACARIFDTHLLIGCLSESALGAEAEALVGGVAEHFRGMVYSGHALRDWAGRLIIDVRGTFDEGALPPAYFCVATRLPLAKARQQVKEELGARAERLRWYAADDVSGFPFSTSVEKQVGYLEAKPRNAKAAQRLEQLHQFWSGVRTLAAFETEEDPRRDLSEALGVSSACQGIVMDGWSFLAPDGHLLLDRGEQLSSDASLPAVAG